MSQINNTLAMISEEPEINVPNQTIKSSREELKVSNQKMSTHATSRIYEPGVAASSAQRRKSSSPRKGRGTTKKVIANDDQLIEKTHINIIEEEKQKMKPYDP